MSEWGLINYLKEGEKTQNIPIVISSALEKSEIEKYLTKPFQPHELSTTIVEFLLQSETGDVLFMEPKEEIVQQ
ncbi:hypothetical protein [Halalkalibacter alkalisediminis]|uniref:Response regulatory domain-containing protein n=1 Tax=Halalkalibacter alkalisediminis TaxID=935616 RepID=A0ABV6NC66_9BACI|nr:hypothetical protein [Halalkalibacter alkalisediminis]